MMVIVIQYLIVLIINMMEEIVVLLLALDPIAVLDPSRMHLVQQIILLLEMVFQIVKILIWFL
jgi:hypothetical protein